MRAPSPFPTAQVAIPQKAKRPRVLWRRFEIREEDRKYSKVITIQRHHVDADWCSEYVPFRLQRSISVGHFARLCEPKTGLIEGEKKCGWEGFKSQRVD